VALITVKMRGMESAPGYEEAVTLRVREAEADLNKRVNKPHQSPAPEEKGQKKENCDVRGDRNNV